jgi:hypothetical protein
MMRSWGYAALCLILPMAWGLIVVWASGRIEGLLRRLLGPADKAAHPEGDPKSFTPEYHI